jgi:phosphocarrier protein
MDVSGGSIMGLMMLAASIGSELEIRAKGSDAKAAVDALVDLIQRKFDEE